jgi:hypothetical protein
MGWRIAMQSGAGGGRGDHGQLHGERFQHFVLHPARNAQGRDRQRGVLQVRSGIGHATGDKHLRQLPQGQHAGAGAGPDYPELGVRARGEHQWPDGGRKPLHRVFVGPVVHGAGKHQHRRWPRIRRGPMRIAREVLKIYAVLHRVHLRGVD